LFSWSLGFFPLVCVSFFFVSEQIRERLDESLPFYLRNREEKSFLKKSEMRLKGAERKDITLIKQREGSRDENKSKK